MAGVEKIIEKIWQDSEGIVGSILADAQKQAEEIVNKGRLKAEEKAEAIRKKALNDAAEKKRIANSMAELEMRKNVLLTKQSIIEEVFEKALHSLNSLEGDEYLRVLHNMLLSAVETGDEEILLSADGKSKVPEDFLTQFNKSLAATGKKGSIRLSEQNADINGGFILKSRRAEINNSFEALIRTNRDELEPKVAQMLF